MEGRWKRLLTGSVLVGLVGCSSLRDRKPALPPANTAEPPLSLSAKPTEKPGPIKVETLVAFANVRVEAAMHPDRAERDREKLLTEARNTYQEALKRDPNNLDAMLGMAHVYRGMQEKDRCVEWYQKATKAQPKNAAIWGEMGQSLDGLKDRDAAINCYHMATKIDPVNKDYRKALGFALARAGRYEEGLAWLSKCMQPADAHVAIARMMDHNGHREKATQQFVMALKVDPNNETARLAINNLAPPSNADRIPDASVIQTASYEQYTPLQTNAPVANIPAASKPIILETKPAPAAASLRPPDPMPLFLNRSGAPTSAPAPVQGWIQSR